MCTDKTFHVTDSAVVRYDWLPHLSATDDVSWILDVTNS